MMLEDFLGGAIAMGFSVASLMFVSFWRRSREKLFLAFGASFLLLALNQALIALSNIALEEKSWLYLLRLVAFLLIIWAIWDHNREIRGG